MRHLFTTVTIFLSLAFCAYAQIATTTALVGTVTDTTGTSVPGAKVTAVNRGTHDAYPAVTNEQGYYNIQFIAVGDYDLTIEHPGFQSSKVTGIHVDINQAVRTDVALKVGNVVESIVVQATAAAIKTDDPTVSKIISTRSVSALPLNGRDAMQL